MQPLGFLQACNTVPPICPCLHCVRFLIHTLWPNSELYIMISFLYTIKMLKDFPLPFQEYHNPVLLSLWCKCPILPNCGLMLYLWGTRAGKFLFKTYLSGCCWNGSWNTVIVGRSGLLMVDWCCCIPEYILQMKTKVGPVLRCWQTHLYT